jgi:hypothetical protein
MHKRLLPAEKWRWYLQDVFVPLIVSVAIAGIGRSLITRQSPQYIILFEVVIISILTLGLTALSTSVTRTWVFEKASKIKLAYEGR